MTKTTAEIENDFNSFCYECFTHGETGQREPDHSMATLASLVCVCLSLTSSSWLMALLFVLLS